MVEDKGYGRGGHAGHSNNQCVSCSTSYKCHFYVSNMSSAIFSTSYHVCYLNLCAVIKYHLNDFNLNKGTGVQTH